MAQRHPPGGGDRLGAGRVEPVAPGHAGATGRQCAGQLRIPRTHPRTVGACRAVVRTPRCGGAAAARGRELRAVIRCRTLGTVEVSVDGDAAPARLLWRKNLALLLYLARSPKGARARDHLIGLFWPDKP